MSYKCIHMKVGTILYRKSQYFEESFGLRMSSKLKELQVKINEYAECKHENLEDNSYKKRILSTRQWKLFCHFPMKMCLIVIRGKKAQIKIS